MVDGPAVQGSALRGGTIHQFGMLTQGRDRRADRGGADRRRGATPEESRGLGNIGAARRIRHTAAAEKDITTARDKSADAGDATPYRCSKASTLLSTSAP